MVLGITGSIASGKSSVAQEFERLGAVVVDADQLARAAVAPGSDGLDRLVKAFGGKILNTEGSLNRGYLADIVFADPEARKKLNEILHPAIAVLARSRLAELRTQPDIPLIVYEAPLLFEAGAQGRVDKVLVVRVDPHIQRQRLVQRDSLNGEEADNRIVAQMSQEEKLKRADYVIDNSGSLQEMKEQVVALWEELTALI